MLIVLIFPRRTLKISVNYVRIVVMQWPDVMCRNYIFNLIIPWDCSLILANLCLVFLPTKPFKCLLMINYKQLLSVMATLNLPIFPTVLRCRNIKGTLIQIWKSANIFVFIWKYHVEDFTLKLILLFEICVS